MGGEVEAGTGVLVSVDTTEQLCGVIIWAHLERGKQTVMADGRNKYQSRENRARVREVLMREWDPIGIADDPDASDQYDRYADKVYVMLMDEHASAAAIAAYLYDIATDYMALTPYPELLDKCANTASILVGLRPEFGTH